MASQNSINNQYQTGSFYQYTLLYEPGNKSYLTNKPLESITIEFLQNKLGIILENATLSKNTILNILNTSQGLVVANNSLRIAVQYKKLDQDAFENFTAFTRIFFEKQFILRVQNFEIKVINLSQYTQETDIKQIQSQMQPIKNVQEFKQQIQQEEIQQEANQNSNLSNFLQKFNDVDDNYTLFKLDQIQAKLSKTLDMQKADTSQQTSNFNQQYGLAPQQDPISVFAFFGLEGNNNKHQAQVNQSPQLGKRSFSYKWSPEPKYLNNNITSNNTSDVGRVSKKIRNNGNFEQNDVNLDVFSAIENSKNKNNPADSSCKKLQGISQTKLNLIQTPDKEDNQSGKASLQRIKMLLENRQASLSDKKQTNSEICSICLNDFSNDIGKLQCSHKYCFLCIKDWSNVTNKCPLCKRLFNEIEKRNSHDKLISKLKVENKEAVIQDEQYQEVDDSCYVCRSSDNDNVMLLCDSCDFRCCHIYCLNPPLQEIPQGLWFCDYCTGERQADRRTRNRTSRNRGQNRQQVQRRDSLEDFIVDDQDEDFDEQEEQQLNFYQDVFERIDENSHQNSRNNSRRRLTRNNQGSHNNSNMFQNINNNARNTSINRQGRDQLLEFRSEQYRALSYFSRQNRVRQAYN